jgi:hypothetical protein
MENKVKKALSDFVDEPQVEEMTDTRKAKEVVLNERTGLIERLDRVLVTSDGRQLLREQY